MYAAKLYLKFKCSLSCMIKSGLIEPTRIQHCRVIGMYKTFG